MKYRKKPVVIDAFRFRIDNIPDWFMDGVSDLSIVTYYDFCHIHTLEGKMTGRTGDWIIRGVKGECYPCKPDIFEMTYELAEPHPASEDIIAKCIREDGGPGNG